MSVPSKKNNIQKIQDDLKHVKHIIAVASCKGGVGKSTVAAALAREFAKQGKKIGLIDADIYGPSVPTLFHLPHTPLKTNENRKLIPPRVQGVQLMSFGFLLGDAPAVMRGPLVSRYIQQLFQMTDWGELDYLFIDMPPGTGDVQLTITQSLRLDGAVIVTTPQTLSLVDVQRGILMFEKVEVPILGIIENMSYFLCGECQTQHFIFGRSTQKLNERFGVKTLAEIPLDTQFMQELDSDSGNAFIKTAIQELLKSVEDIRSGAKSVPEITFDEQNVSFLWEGGEKIIIRNRDLRLNCQCALCMDEISGKKILKPQRVRSDIAPREITPLGNYAVGITWNDGHSSGIYPYQSIRQLVAEEEKSDGLQ